MLHKQAGGSVYVTHLVTSCHVTKRNPVPMQVGFSNQHRDALVTRQACIALTQLATTSDKPSHTSLQAVYKALTRALLSDGLPDSTWYTAAEAAVTALYAVHPAPQELAQVIVARLGKAALQGNSPPQAAAGDFCTVACPVSMLQCLSGCCAWLGPDSVCCILVKAAAYSGQKIRQNGIYTTPEQQGAYSSSD